MTSEQDPTSWGYSKAFEAHAERTLEELIDKLTQRGEYDQVNQILLYRRLGSLSLGYVQGKLRELEIGDAV